MKGDFGEDDVKAYRAKRLVVITHMIMRMLDAEEERVDFVNLAVPSPILRETEPILVHFHTQKEFNESE